MYQHQVNVRGGQFLQEPPDSKLALKVAEVCWADFGCDEQIFSSQPQLWKRTCNGGGQLFVVTVEICCI